MKDLKEPEGDLLKCCRCRNKHYSTERIEKRTSNGWNVVVCPRCSGESYYNLSESERQKALTK